MTLAVHIIVGGAVAQLTPHPALGFLMGFASHFLLDALPHWDYHLNFLHNGKGSFSFRDLVKLGIDSGLGLAALLLLISYFDAFNLWLAFAGATGGLFPDFLQLIYLKFHWRFLHYFQAFHDSMHT